MYPSNLLNQTQIENMSFYDGLNKDFLLISLTAHELLSIDTGSHIREVKNNGSQSRSGLIFKHFLFKNICLGALELTDSSQKIINNLKR